MKQKMIIQEKLASLERCLKRIKQHTPFCEEELDRNYDKQDIINLNLQRAIQLSVDIASSVISMSGIKQPTTMAETFLILGKEHIIPEKLALTLAKSVGFRNVAVHEYDTLNISILFSIITKELDCFLDFSKAIFLFLDKHN